MKKRKLLYEVQLSEKVVLKTFESEKWKKHPIIGIEREIILPEVSNEKLWEIYQQIKPVVDINEFYYWARNLKPSELRNISYVWDTDKNKKKSNLIDKSRIEVIDEFDCFHTYGYYGMFKPSVAEVLQQMPNKLLKHTNAFYISQWPRTADDLNREREIVNAGCHKSKVQAMIIEK